MNKYFLNKHIRFRKERGYILICNCKQLLDFEVPTKYYKVLKKLEEGCTVDDKYLPIIKEMYSIGIVDIKGRERKAERNDILSKLTYDETEFFR